MNTLLVRRNWLIGFRIAEKEIGKSNKSEYGLNIIKNLSKKLAEIFHSVSEKSQRLLSQTHYSILHSILLQVHDNAARDWYAKEAEIETQKAIYYLQQKEQEENSTKCKKAKDEGSNNQ